MKEVVFNKHFATGPDEQTAGTVIPDDAVADGYIWMAAGSCQHVFADYELGRQWLGKGNPGKCFIDPADGFYLQGIVGFKGGIVYQFQPVARKDKVEPLLLFMFKFNHQY